MKKLNYQEEITKQLSVEYNCSPDDFLKSENIITQIAIKDGQRVYTKEQNFFKMATFGSNAVISADKVLHPFLQSYTKDKTGHYLFEIPNLLPIEKELNKYGHTLTQTLHMFLPSSHREPEKKYPVKWYFDEEIHTFYGDERFPNAICPKYDPLRPDRIVVCAYDGNKIMGMAGCSEDTPELFQIGMMYHRNTVPWVSVHILLPCSRTK